jgi:small subunit ribosomal protein S13
MFPFVDNLLSFRTKMYNLDNLNIYQFFFQRIGIGKTTSNRILLYMGYSPFFKAKKIKNSSKTKEVKQFFINNTKNLDKNIKKIESTNIEKYLKNKSYRGIRHKYKYPVRGQRTRSNAYTKKNKLSKKKKNIK